MTDARETGAGEAEVTASRVGDTGATDAGDVDAYPTDATDTATDSIATGPGAIGSAGRTGGARSTPPPIPPGGPRRPHRGRGLAVVLTLLIVVVGGAAVVGAFLLSAPSATPREVEFEVLPGWAGKRVAGELAEAGLVRSATAFEYYLRFRDIDHSIGEGLYDLDPTMSAGQVAESLVAGGRPRVIPIVLPEGVRAAGVVDRLVQSGVASRETLEAAVEDPGLDLAAPYAPADQGLEGYLFPAVYDVPVHATAEDALRQMVERFRAEVAGREDLAERLGELGLTVHQWVTLASMVQAEAANEGEMPVIAGVFLNRRELGMPLQSDPTVAYGLGKPMPELDAVAGDLRVDTPWNTYTRPGLPQGPIGNPGSEALDAVLEPQRYAEDGALYLFFLHGSQGGQTVFRPNTNLPAHNRDVETFLRAP